MNRYDGEKFAKFSYGFAAIKAIFDKNDKGYKLPEDTKKSFLDLVNAVNVECHSIGLRLSVISTNRLRLELSNNEVDVKKLSSLLQELSLRVSDELSALTLISLSANKLSYFEKAALFGQQVSDSFPNANFEIEEAGNCLALERNTACVMHLMRTLEIALKAVALGLGITPSDISSNPNWGNILTLIKNKIDANNRINDAAWISNKAFFESVHTHLNSVRVAWRNPTMHVTNTYTEDSAEDIFNSVKGLMRHLATKLDENGNLTP